MNARDIAYGYAIGYNDGLGGASSNEWQPPKDWLEVPEPGEWEANFLIEIRNKPTFGLQLDDPQNGSDRYGKITVDWGDGTIETDESWVDEYGYKQHRKTQYTHTYEKPGQYIVKVVADESSCYLHYGYSKNGEALLIAKIGEKIRLAPDNSNNYTGFFSERYRLRWIKINSRYRLPTQCFYDCTSLCRLDLAEPLAEIPDYCFVRVSLPANFDYSKIKKIGQSGFNLAKIPEKLFLDECTEIGKNAFNNCMSALKEVNFPKCLSVGDFAFGYNFNIKSFSAPLCTNVGANAFSSCYALETAEFADDCVYGKNCFQYCRSFYPRPDGSAN